MATTTFNNCKAELVDLASDFAQEKYHRWTRRPGFGEVVNFVTNFSHRHLYDISSRDVAAAIAASQHALGDVNSSEQLRLVEDFSTPFAYQHLFHWYIEHHKKVPTWKAFRDWMVTGDAATKWYLPLKNYLEENGRQFTREQWSRAAKWRLGKVYMSNIRELDLLVRLREAGLPVKYHLLADVLLRVDFWCQNVLVCVYFPNPKYRDGSEGRKLNASRFFDTENGTFTVLHFDIKRQGFGKIWLATDKSVEELIDQIRVTAKLPK